MNVQTISTKPYPEQKPGTSGLRKKVIVVQQPHYLENFIQSLFDSLPEKDLRDCTLLVSGDGRYYNRTAIQTIAELAAANGVKRLWIGQHGLISTPAASAVIRERENGICYGGIILTASHNPGGPEEDFGIKFNTSNGGPALELITNKIYERSLTITEYKKVQLPLINLNKLGKQSYCSDQFHVEIINPIEDWLIVMRRIFDFKLIQTLFARDDFSFVYDGLHGVAGIYAKELFYHAFHLEDAPPKKRLLIHCDPKEDFGGGHPDPNLTYAKALVEIMKVISSEIPEDTPQFGAAGDGDNDRCMILGKGFFVTPSDSVALIVSYAKKCIPYFQKTGIKGVARSMPTSSALDHVALSEAVPLYETPTGWKYFGTLMESNQLSICGEESFGSGSDHIREKDGLWAVLCWLSILAYRNSDRTAPFVSVKTIVEDHWKIYGRNYYTRYDYENIDKSLAQLCIDHLHSCIDEDVAVNLNKLQTVVSKGTMECLKSSYKLKLIDNFTYKDPIDHTVTKNQGIRFLFEDGSRIIWRVSGTGSQGTTIRMYIEKYEKKNIYLSTKEALKDLVQIALDICQIKKFCHRDAPTVIT